jgi:predicted phage gp36 major capsid-like protein
MDVVESLHPEYRANAVWVMRRATFSAIRKLKVGGTGAYLLDTYGVGFAPPGIAAPAPGSATVPAATTISFGAGGGIAAPMLLGHPVVMAEDMPAIGANALPIAFGDFMRGYTIAEKPGLRLLPDPYSEKPHIIMNAWMRVGGAVADFNAIKFVRFST